MHAENFQEVVKRPRPLAKGPLAPKIGQRPFAQVKRVPVQSVKLHHSIHGPRLSNALGDYLPVTRGHAPLHHDRNAGQGPLIRWVRVPSPILIPLPSTFFGRRCKKREPSRA